MPSETSTVNSSTAQAIRVPPSYYLGTPEYVRCFETPRSKNQANPPGGSSTADIFRFRYKTYVESYVDETGKRFWTDGHLVESGSQDPEGSITATTPVAGPSLGRQSESRPNDVSRPNSIVRAGNADALSVSGVLSNNMYAVLADEESSG